MPARVQHVTADQVRRVALPPELDLSVIDQVQRELAAALDEPGCRSLVVDCAGLRFIDCASVGMLLRIRHMATDTGQTMHLINISGLPLRVIHLVGVAPQLGLLP